MEGNQQWTQQATADCATTPSPLPTPVACLFGCPMQPCVQMNLQLTWESFFSAQLTGLAYVKLSQRSRFRCSYISDAFTQLSAFPLSQIKAVACLPK